MSKPEETNLAQESPWGPSKTLYKRVETLIPTPRWFSLIYTLSLTKTILSSHPF